MCTTMQALSLRCARLLKSKGCDDDNMFSVKYLGQGELEKPGLKDMCSFVDSLCREIRNSKQVNPLKGHFILSNENCFMKPGESSVEDEMASLVFRTRRIQFCGVYEQNPKIFFFTYQFGRTADIVQCHVLKCKSKKEAKCLAKKAGSLFKDIAFTLNRRVKDASTSSRSPLSSRDSQTSSTSVAMR